jgi:GTP cyclohydrolase II
LDEYCSLTGQNRSYVIRKIQSRGYLKLSKRKRKPKYDQKFVDILAQVWEKFGFPCGKKLEILLKKEVDNLRKSGELKCSEEVAQKLKEITSSTIDLKLRKKKRYLRNKILKRGYF